MMDTKIKQTFHYMSVTPGVQVHMVRRHSTTAYKFFFHHLYCHDVLAYDDNGLPGVVVCLIRDDLDSLTDSIQPGLNAFRDVNCR